MAFSSYNRQRFRPEPPVKEGQTYEVVVESVGEKGDGIAKVEGFVVIVPGTKKGDKVKVIIKAVRGSVSFAEVVERQGTAEVVQAADAGNAELAEGNEEVEGADEDLEEPEEDEGS